MTRPLLLLTLDRRRSSPLTRLAHAHPLALQHLALETAGAPRSTRCTAATARLETLSTGIQARAVTGGRHGPVAVDDGLDNVVNLHSPANVAQPIVSISVWVRA